MRTAWRSGRPGRVELVLVSKSAANTTRSLWTIADLANVDDITAEHVSEAIHYRHLDRQL